MNTHTHTNTQMSTVLASNNPSGDRGVYIGVYIYRCKCVWACMGKQSELYFYSESHLNKDPNVIHWNEVRNTIIWFQDPPETAGFVALNEHQAKLERSDELHLEVMQ